MTHLKKGIQNFFEFWETDVTTKQKYKRCKLNCCNFPYLLIQTLRDENSPTCIGTRSRRSHKLHEGICARHAIRKVLQEVPKCSVAEKQHILQGEKIHSIGVPCKPSESISSMRYIRRSKPGVDSRLITS